jgi:hypothetical protein
MTPARQTEADRWKAADPYGLARLQAKAILEAYPRTDRHQHGCVCETCMKPPQGAWRPEGAQGEMSRPPYRDTNYRYTLRCGWRWVWNDLRRGALVVALRTAWWALVRGHDGETCGFCGRPYILWHSPDDLWVAFSGNSGCCCPSCFDLRAYDQGVVLKWKPEVYLARDTRFADQETARYG